LALLLLFAKNGTIALAAGGQVNFVAVAKTLAIIDEIQQIRREAIPVDPGQLGQQNPSGVLQEGVLLPVQGQRAVSFFARQKAHFTGQLNALDGRPVVQPGRIHIDAHPFAAVLVMRDGKIAEAQIAQADADKTQAQIDLYSYRIKQATILAPLTGTLVTGDLKRQIGAPVETGKVLFEIAPLDALRAELHVPEDEVSEVKVGQQGRLATASFPGQHLRFIIERVNPAAEVVNHRNIFKVRVRLLETQPWIRPGMEGVAKITIEKRRYAWIWSRKVINWIRMKLWI